MYKKSILSSALAAMVFGSTSAVAAITEEEVARLSKDLTPVGAERAGNADGTIPAWTGGLTEALPGWPNAKNDRPNPHQDDKVLYTITADNMDKYADKLTEGTRAMLKTYPDSFKMNVYPTRRTAASPQFIYDAIAKNATTAELTEDGNSVTGVWGSIPFPIPKNGSEVIWNHMLRYQGKSREFVGYEAVNFNNGQGRFWFLNGELHAPFYDENASDKDLKNRTMMKLAMTTQKPPRDAGEGYLLLDSVDMVTNPRKAWTYDPGERRVRRAPNLAFDTPDRPMIVIDDYELFSGSPERYDWKLLGKQEMLVPYNNNEINSPSKTYKEVVGSEYLNSDLIRYELHRVWVVEATVKDGQRHLYQKRKLYIDEDSWTALASDKYDGNGNLWKVSYFYPIVASEIPLTGGGAYTNIDLKKNGYYLMNLTIEGQGFAFNVDPRPSSYFTPGAVRRRGR